MEEMKIRIKHDQDGNAISYYIQESDPDTEFELWDVFKITESELQSLRKDTANIK